MSKKWISVLSAILFVFILATNTYSASPDNIIKTAREHLNTPYKWGGISPGGFDCSGYIYYVFKENGITLPRTSNGQYSVGTTVKKSELQPGDLVFFETYEPGPSHSGIYVGDQRFIHASSSKGVSIASINDPYYWGSRYLGAKRVVTNKENDEEELQKQIQLQIAALESGEYLDVPKDHWAHQEIKTLSLNSIINGATEGFYNPNHEVTRAQAAKLISSVKGLPLHTNKTSYSDVPVTHWAAQEIAAVTEANLFNVTGTKFEPNIPLTRAEVAQLFSIAFELEVKEKVTVPSFNDLQPSHPAYDSIMKVTTNELLNGFLDNTYRPDEFVTRAQFAKILYSATQK